MTLVLESTSKKKLLLLKELALELGVKVSEIPNSTSQLKAVADKNASKNQLMQDIETSLKQLKDKQKGVIKFNSVTRNLTEVL